MGEVYLAEHQLLNALRALPEEQAAPGHDEAEEEGAEDGVHPQQTCSKGRKFSRLKGSQKTTYNIIPVTHAQRKTMHSEKANRCPLSAALCLSSTSLTSASNSGRTSHSITAAKPHTHRNT